jgi:hypothetical protein
VTVIADEAVFPSLEAVMDTFPAATAVTSPAVETLAIAVFAELHVTTRPVSTLLLASRVVAESWTVAPTRRLDEVGETDTDATGIGAGVLTVTVADPVTPSPEAEIVALPAVPAVTTPL